MSDIEHNIVFDDPNRHLRSQHIPLVAQFNVSTHNLQSTVPKYDNLFQKNNKAKVPRLKPPYRKRDIDRFEDTFRSDGTVRNGLTKKWNFILGAHTSVSLDVDREYQNDDQRAEAMNQVLQYEPYKIAMDRANEVLRKCGFRKVIHAAGIQASIYGRSCIEKVRSPDGKKIVRLNVLNSKLLGDVEVDKDSWEFVGVHYRDLPKHDDLLEAEDIIYITRNDYHVSAGSMFYGLSDLEPIIDGSETKRIIKQEDLKEIARSLWAGFGWMLFKDPNITHEQMSEIVNKMKAGAWTATDQTVELQVQEIAQNAPMLLEIINEMNLETARDLAIPSPLVGYENKQNYSNLVQTLISWKESDLDSERRWLSDLIETQLLREIFQCELDAQGVQMPDDSNQNLAVPQLQQIPNEQPLNPLQPNGLITTQINVIPPAKITLDITDPNFTPFKEKMELTLQMYDKSLISARKVLEVADMEDQIEETELRLQEMELQKQQMMNFQQNVFQSQVQQTDKVQQKRMSLLDKMEGQLGKLSNGNSGGGGPSAAGGGQIKQPYRMGEVLLDNIVDPDIKNLYKEYLQTKTQAVKSVINEREQDTTN